MVLQARVAFTPVAAVLSWAALGTPTLAQEDCPDLAPRLLRTRAGGHTGVAGGFNANELFHYTGQDNARVLLRLPDITGDGRDELVAGYDIFQNNDNLFCFDGASSGLASIVWSFETSGGLSGGYFFGDQGLSLAADVTGNGVPEVLAGLGGGGRFAAAYDGLTGSLIWRFDTYNTADSGWVYCIREAGDVNGDQVADVVFGTGSDSDSVYMIDGTSTGTNPTVLWSYQHLDAIYSVTAPGDLSGDGVPDVVAGAGDNDPAVFAFNGANGNILWSMNLPGSVWHIHHLDDLDGDGVAEVLLGTWNSGDNQVVCLDGAAGGVLWAAGTGDPVMRVEPIEDVDGDGKPDVLVASWDNGLNCVSSSDGSSLWRAPAGNLNGGDVWTAAVIDDVNGDCQDDALFGSFDGNVYLADGTDGTQLWSHATGNRIYAVAEGGDLNRDGGHEALIATQDTTNSNVVRVVEGDSGLEGPATMTLVGTPQLGAAVTLQMTAPGGSLVFLYVALGDGCIPVAPFGNLQLDPSTLLRLALFSMPAGGTFNLNGSIPNDGSLLGLVPHLQALSMVSAGPPSGSLTNRLRFPFLP